MRVLRRPLVLALALCVSAAARLFAADTGSVSGAVFDQNGHPVSDATVKISGDQMPAGRTTQTDANGSYTFLLLLPGKYTIQVEKPGVGSSTRPVEVQVDKDTQVELVIGVRVKEEVTISAATPAVDLKSAAVNFNFNSELFEALPLERTYRGLFQLIPGVPENRSTVGPAAGGDRQDNTYLIDGANITNPGFGTLSTEINELDISEVNIKRAGISAEFGRTGGVVTNAVSRTGTNQLSGIGRVDFLPQGLISGFELPSALTNAGFKPGTFRDPLLTTEISPAVGVGGPILKDHIFFYGSARYFDEQKKKRTNRVATALPDEKRSGHELFGKATGMPTSLHQINLSFRYRPNHVDNASLTSNTTPSLATTTDNSSRVASLQYAWFIASGSSVDVRYVYLKEKNEDVPVTSLGYLPAFNPNNLSAMGQYTDSQNLTSGGNQYTNHQNYRRHEVHGTFTKFFDTGRLGHTFKAGGGYEFGEEDLNRLANGWGTIVNITSGGVPALRSRYYTTQPSQRGQGRTYSLFVQDDLTVSNRLIMNLGVLLNRDEFAQNVVGSSGCPSTVVLKGGNAVYESTGDTCRFLRFGFGDEIQPRLGASYNLRQGKGDKLYANWGRYYNMDQKSSGRSLAPSRIFQTQTVFDLNGNVLSSGPLASTTGKRIDPDIKPIYTDEVLVGYAAPVVTGVTAEVFFMHRKMNNFIEDVPSTLPDTGPYIASNLPCSRTPACQGAVAKRSYRAVTLELRRAFSHKWTGSISYTRSRFEGNFDLDYASGSVFNTSSFIQDGPGTFVQDPNRFGPLNEDRPNVFKVFATYFPTSRVTAAAYLRAQSGAPWTARARDWEGAVLNYLEPAGSHRNPAWANLDLMGAYKLPLSGSRANISFEGRLLNVFNNQTQLSTDAQKFTDLRTIPTPPYFADYLVPNASFGLGNGFAPPRRLYLSAVVNF